MYQSQILKSIIKYKDYLALTRLHHNYDNIFIDANNKELYLTLMHISGRYNEIPDSKFLKEYFNAEKVSKAKDTYNALISDDNIGITKNILQLIDQQILYLARKKTQQVLKSAINDFKLCNASDIENKLTDLIDNLNLTYKSLDNSDNNEGLMYHDAEVSSINTIKQKLINDYDLRKSGAQGYYCFDTGIDAIDKAIGGINSVEFMGILGFVKNGKSFLCRQIAYNVLCQGKNVVFITLEMSYESIQHSFLSLHANNTTFWGYDLPKIKISDIRAGSLTDKAERFYKEQVIDDFTTNPDMGSLYIKQPNTSRYTLEELVSDVRNLKHNMDVDLLVIDYPSLMQPSSNKRDRDAYNELFRNLRGFGLANHIPIIFPIQTNRAGYEQALKNKDNLFSADAIADYSSIEREATNIISIITTPQLRESGQSQIQHIISRESQLFNPFLLNADFETGVLSEIARLSKEDTDQIINEIEI